jgi:murein DD-endopeptidase MepM/ murein hydrolase activator NlpD
MNILITEDQAKKIMSTLDEQDKSSGEEKTDTSNLEVLGKLYSNPVSTILDKLSPEAGKSLLAQFGMSGDDKNSGGNGSNGSETFAPNIPVGKELMHPLGKKVQVISPFGNRTIGNQRQNHKGVDLPTPVGSPVYAPADGKVDAARDTTPNGCGGFVKLTHSQLQLQTKFCHLSKWLVSTGQEVKKGQVIAYSGGQRGAQYAGNSQGPHLHYEVLDSGGIAMNPARVQSDMA